MKKISLVIVFITTLLINGCGSSSDTATETETESSTEVLKASANTLNPYQVYVEEMLSDRTKAFRLFEQVTDQDPLSGADLDAMSHMLGRHLDIKDKTSDYIEKYQYLVDHNDEKYTQKERFELVMISLSAMLGRYDDYLLTYKNFDDQDNLRQELNHRHYFHY